MCNKEWAVSVGISNNTAEIESRLAYVRQVSVQKGIYDNSIMAPVGLYVKVQANPSTDQTDNGQGNRKDSARKPVRFMDRPIIIR